MAMRSLVVGGAGFLGSHLVRALVARGQEVVVADNLATALSHDLLGSAGELHHVDVRCPEDFRRLPSGPYDRVYHLAASYANELSMEHPLLDLRTNVEGTLHLLDFAARQGCGLFIYTGSSSSYGDAPLPFHEDGPMLPQTPYALHKHVAEWHVKRSGLPAAVFRLFNVYGPGDPPGTYRNAIPNMISAAARTGSLRVFGEGATRDFNFVDDVVQVLAEPEPARGMTLNIGTGRETLITDLARMILALFDASSDGLRIEPPRSWDRVLRRCADVQRLENLYGPRPLTPLQDGLGRTASWLYEHGHIRRAPV